MEIVTHVKKRTKSDKTLIIFFIKKLILVENKIKFVVVKRKPNL